MIKYHSAQEKKRICLVIKGVNRMSLDALKTAKKAIGIKQVTKAIEKELVQEVFIAKDAEQRLVEQLQIVCSQKNVAVDVEFTMMELGKSCGIEVGAAAVAVLK